MAIRSSPTQRRFARAVGRVNIGLIAPERLTCLRLARNMRKVSRRLPAMILGLHIGPLLKEKRDHTVESLQGGEMQMVSSRP